MIHSSYLQYGQSRVEYRQFGNGPELLIAFHGFSDKAALFDVLEPAFSKNYTFYAISLPYHGHTQWQPRLFTRNDISQIISLIAEKEQKKRFSLMGYSMGGKIVLNMVPVFASYLNKVYLLAPDGIKTHRLYDIHAMPAIGLSLIKSLLKRPRWLFALAGLLYRQKILSKFLYDFTLNHFGTPAQRERFFNVSESIMQFAPSLPDVRQHLNQYRVPVEMYLGMRDEVIPPEAGMHFGKGLVLFDMHLLDKGHLLVDADLARFISKKKQEARHP